MRKRICVAVLLQSLLITGCEESPTLTITNKSPIPIIVRVEGKKSLGDYSLISLSPGESSKRIANDYYSVAAAPNNEWLKEARIARDLLNEKLVKLNSNSDSMNPAEFADLRSRLKSIDDKIDALAHQPSSRCSLEILNSCNADRRGEDKQEQSNGYVQIYQQSDGALSVSCATGP